MQFKKSYVPFFYIFITAALISTAGSGVFAGNEICSVRDEASRQAKIDDLIYQAQVYSNDFLSFFDRGMLPEAHKALDDWGSTTEEAEKCLKESDGEDKSIIGRMSATNRWFREVIKLNNADTNASVILFFTIDIANDGDFEQASASLNDLYNEIEKKDENQKDLLPPDMVKYWQDLKPGLTAKLEHDAALNNVMNQMVDFILNTGLNKKSQTEHLAITLGELKTISASMNDIEYFSWVIIQDIIKKIENLLKKSGGV